MVADAFHIVIAQIGNVSSYRVAHRVELDGAAHRLDHGEELLGLVVERGADVLQQRLERPQLEWHPCSPVAAAVLEQPLVGSVAGVGGRDGEQQVRLRAVEGHGKSREVAHH